MHALEKEIATCSSVLAWRTPGTEEPGRVQSMKSDTTEAQQTHVGLLTHGTARE